MAGETLVVQAQSMKPGQSTPAVDTAIGKADLGRRLLAEFVGTALLVIFGAGALVAALEMGKGELDYAGLGIVALSFALVIAAVVYMFGTTSGAHINPAVTFSLAVVRRFPWVEVGPYIAAQLAGRSSARSSSTRSSDRTRAT